MKNRSHAARPPASRQQGATLIEVLVSILLMSIGLVAMAAMQANAVNYSKTSEMRSLASLLANDITDRMRANPSAISSYTSSGAYAAPSDATISKSCVKDDTNGLSNDEVCSDLEMATYDLAFWKKSLFQQLPQGTGYIRPVTGTNQVDIWVAWTDPATTIDQTADSCPSQYNAPDGVRCMYFRITL